jgi:hypothetical protein
VVRALAVMVIAACAAPQPSQQAPANHVAAGEGSVDALAAAALRRVADRLASGDHGVLPASGPVTVLLEVERPQGLVLDAASIPSGLARPFVGRRRSEIHAEVDRTRLHVAFVYFERLEVEGTRGRVKVGVDWIDGPPDRMDALHGPSCALRPVDEYELRDGAWRFVGSGPNDCAKPPFIDFQF